MEAITVLIDHKMAAFAEANAKREGRVDPNNLKEQAGNGSPMERVNLDGPDDWAGKGCPKMRSTKVPTKRRHGFSVKTIGEDVSSEDNFSVASRDKVRSAGTDDDLDDKAVGAALRTHLNGAASGGRRLRWCCLLSETPRTYRYMLEALPVFYWHVQ